MAEFQTVTDAELARAGQDPAYRQDLLKTNLDRLLSEINRRKHAPGRDPALARQLREGSLLAVRLADIISRLETGR